MKNNKLDVIAWEHRKYFPGRTHEKVQVHLTKRGKPAALHNPSILSPVKRGGKTNQYKAHRVKADGATHRKILCTSRVNKTTSRDRLPLEVDLLSV